MLLVGYDLGKIGVGILCVSLAILLLIIAYRKLLQYLGRGAINKQDFVVLHSLEQDPVSGTVDIYFTTDTERDYSIWVLDGNMQQIKSVKEGVATPGGTIVRFDTTELSNGHYFYCLQTSNQKTMKKMHIANS